MKILHSASESFKKIVLPASFLAACVFMGLPAQAEVISPTPSCTDSECTVTFEYSGQGVVWTVPEGVQALSFDVQGAQGGRAGGKGGRVEGTFQTVPETLYIFVGGAGRMGTFPVGGFNGGGQGGAYWGDEASGGGASDIRTSADVANRVVVAGGGGGTGGGAGGFGGQGGGLIGSSGENGQAFGGGGGTQTAGGAGGNRYGIGENGFPGSSFQGGKGGMSFSSGGGGGGGGYFGGGGGGSDTEDCCYDGGGGGGGSSFADAGLTESIAHTVGYRTGAGVVLLSYPVAPMVVSLQHSSSSSNASNLLFTLDFNQAVTGLERADVAFTQGNCESIEVTGSEKNYLINLSGCQDGFLQLELSENSIVGGSLLGPPAAFLSNTVEVDHTPPNIVFNDFETVVDSSRLDYELLFSEPVSGLSEASFSITGSGCKISSVTMGRLEATVVVDECADRAVVELLVDTSSVVDRLGNSMTLSQLQSNPRRVILPSNTSPIWSPEPEDPAPATPEVNPETPAATPRGEVSKPQTPETISPKANPVGEEISTDVAPNPVGDGIIRELEPRSFKDSALAAYPLEESGANLAPWFIAFGLAATTLGFLIFRRVPPHPAIG